MLVKQVGQHRAVTLVARGEFYGTGATGGHIHRQMNLAILASAVRAMLPRKPFAITQKLDPGPVHQQVQRTRRTDVRALHRDALLPAALG